jgi:acetyl-CoA carboxylase biotin carboxylase subunit
MSYLNMASILSAAEITQADAIHPGYGFLSENAEFARLCRECRINFIGPSPEAIEAMGEKTRARRIAKEAGVPLLPGTVNPVSGLDEATLEAKAIGYPVILKAAAGGGGRGIHIIQNDHELKATFHRASSEAQAAFGDGSLYVEKYLEKARHVEIQVVSDSHGNHFYLGERDCSIQRRHQKIIEESPCVQLSSSLRKKMGETAIQLCQQVGYENVGTIEFLLDEHGHYYFMEMNTRLQVEHPVTEMVTGIDLVKTQLRIAAGEKLNWKQEDLVLKGHSIECRINAENWANFAPSPCRSHACYVAIPSS